VVVRLVLAVLQSIHLEVVTDDDLSFPTLATSSFSREIVRLF